MDERGMYEQDPMNNIRRRRIFSGTIIGLLILCITQTASAAERVYTDKKEGWSLRFPTEWAVTKFESGGVDFRPGVEDYPVHFRSAVSHTGIYYGVQVRKLSLTSAQRRALANGWNAFVRRFISDEALGIADHGGAAQQRIARQFRAQAYWLNNYTATMLAYNPSHEASYRYILVSRDRRNVFLVYRFSIRGSYGGVTVNPALLFDRDFRNIAQSFRILTR